MESNEFLKLWIQESTAREKEPQIKALPTGKLLSCLIPVRHCNSSVHQPTDSREF